MPIDNKYIKKQFEKSLKFYDQNALVQDLTAQKLIAELTKINNNFENILELGAGTGILTKKIAENLHYKNFYANDLVEKSKLYVQKFIPDARFLHGNALKIKPGKKMDLIISNAVFQWFSNLEKAIEILKLNIAPCGILAFSTFSPENFYQIKETTGLTLEYKSTQEIEEILTRQGFEMLFSTEFSKVLEFNTPLELLAHMKHTGVNSLSQTTWTVKKVKDFCDKFSQKYPKTSLTYSPVIIIAKY